MYKAIVKRVIDGDTFAGDLFIPELNVTFNNQKFRLYGVNTPEKEQKGYYEATEFTAQHIENEIVNVVVHGKDAFGRFLVDVFVEGDYKSLNMLLLENKLAVPYRK
jgi:micrococcal nuclease